jgi:hypothetical protein
VALRTRAEADQAFGGPIVVVGMNTMVLDRLRAIQIANITLADGLQTCRLRSDGRLVDASGTLTDFKERPNALVYLNTRVGWPRLAGGCTPGVVVIDRTSFAGADLLDRALAWADAQRTRTVIVVADVGDELTERKLLKGPRHFLRWPWSRQALQAAVWELGAKAPSGSMLSTNALCREALRPLEAACFTASPQDAAFRRVILGLIDAKRVSDPWPRPLILARRLAYGLAQLLPPLDEYNQWAALDHRTTALSSLRYDIEGQRGGNTFPDAWAAYAETRWPELRKDLVDLYDLIQQDNPKLYALAYALERLTAEHPSVPLVIRVPNEAAGSALDAALAKVLPELAPDGTKIRCVPWAEHLPWADRPLVEIHPAAPPPSRLSVLWSMESTAAYFLAYPFELDVLRNAQARVHRGQREALALTRDGLLADASPIQFVPDDLAIAFTLDVDRRPPSSKTTPDLSMGVEVLFEDIPLESSEVRDSTSVGDGATTVLARPVVLEPDGAVWWIRTHGQVETLVAERVVYLRPEELHAGVVVVVPRGEGRDELFGRLVAAAHRRDDLEAFEVLFRRWREACWTAYHHCGTWHVVEDRMRRQGSTVTWQSPRSWAVGTTMAPDNAEDIARIGRISGDALIEQQYRRLDAMARRVRGLHTKLGRLLSAAMSQALDQGGPSLDLLTRILGTDPTELLEEFELRAVRSVGAERTIPSSDIRRVTGRP